ncbi:MAG TPA: 6-phosphogluconolactonase [Candidatus Acidoferrum sp.]|nr:6-phosphogluconolactonase [Candidatus Acidoferrum sp.]
MFFESRIFPDADSLGQAALGEILRILADAVATRGRFSIALSGGHTPAKLYALWSEKYKAQTPWDRVHLFFGDERFVPEDDLLSNYRMARETLISRVPIPKENVHPMLTTYPSPEKAAEGYEVELRKYFGEDAPPSFDVQLLGLGVEGHTASLFPGSPALEEAQRWVLAVTAPAEPPQRLTLTPVVLNQGLNTFFLVTGENKREILAALRKEPQTETSKYPAGRIRPARGVVWYLDEAAAS